MKRKNRWRRLNTLAEGRPCPGAGNDPLQTAVTPRRRRTIWCWCTTRTISTL
uniref:Uncharacterized protein n=1 Tax=Macrostomum lignano TaxID=282301 RepID=A0A1I8HBT2_9PLAT